MGEGESVILHDPTPEASKSFGDMVKQHDENWAAWSRYNTSVTATNSFL